MGRARLAIPTGKVANTLARIREKSFPVLDTIKVDPGAWSAETAAADYLVSGNRKHYPEEWKKTRIVTAREFMEIIANTQSDDSLRPAPEDPE